MLAGLERDLERGRRSCSLGEHLWRKLKWLPLGDPAFDLVEAPLAAQLVDDQEPRRRFGEGARPIITSRAWHGAPILARATPFLSVGSIAPHLLEALDVLSGIGDSRPIASASLLACESRPSQRL